MFMYVKLDLEGEKVFLIDTAGKYLAVTLK
jgi:hypothetical protein